MDKVDYEQGFTARTKEEINSFCEELWPDDSCNERKIDVHVAVANKACFTVRQMYEYVDLDFRILKTVADFFTTLDVRTDQDHHGGCETCDYGSSYEITFTVGKDG